MVILSTVIIVDSHQLGAEINAELHTFLGDPDDVLECDCQFRCVLQLHVNEMSLIYAPDTDALDPILHKSNFKDMSSFVRLKTSSDSASSKSLFTFRK